MESEYCGVRVNDLDCYAKDCPQERDGEPAKSGRNCPRKHWSDDEDY